MDRNKNARVKFSFYFKTVNCRNSELIVIYAKGVDGDAARALQEMRAWSISTEINSLALHQGPYQISKMEKSEPNIARRKGSEV